MRTAYPSYLESVLAPGCDSTGFLRSFCLSRPTPVVLCSLPFRSTGEREPFQQSQSCVFHTLPIASNMSTAFTICAKRKIPCLGTLCRPGQSTGFTVTTTEPLQSLEHLCPIGFDLSCKVQRLVSRLRFYSRAVDKQDAIGNVPG